ncbi:DUF4442 domain-containing protein [Psychrobacter sp. I-STPA10]|uniref:DUF4442 domain-containing protein n=1 Tax=Psychrobacter sp. I-STPA10 TaxID=2585769 RepID=UPI001E4EF080|nr:DUF4442 domain-containing protein [Psychrobacter sp. I-STPA10]
MSFLFDKLTNNHQDDTPMSTDESNGSATPSSSLRPINNQFSKLLTLTKYLPANVRAKILSTAFGKIVPFVGTAGVYYEIVSPNKVVVSLENDKKVQNHIGSIHAVAVTLLAETATGFILGLNLPSDRVLLVKSYNVNFYRPLKKGQVAAVATLSDEQRLHILNTTKGEMVIPCYIEDRNAQQQGQQREPITVEMTWAWIPKDELKKRQSGQQKLTQEATDQTSTEHKTTDITNLEAEAETEVATHSETTEATVETSKTKNPIDNPVKDKPNND